MSDTSAVSAAGTQAATPAAARRRGPALRPPTRLVVPLAVLLASSFAQTPYAGAGVPVDREFRGRFSSDPVLQMLHFRVAAEQTVSLRTTGYDQGGFDPILTLYDADGKLLDENDDESTSRRDAWISLTLAPGLYQLALTQFDNFAAGDRLSAGFERSGSGDYTGREYGPGDGRFYDLDGNARSSAWQVNLSGVEAATTGPLRPPEARLTVTPQTGRAPLAVNVDGSASSDSGGAIASYAWDFGDGATAAGATAGHTYANPGTYTVRLTVTDAIGQQHSATGTVEVTNGGTPAAGFFVDGFEPR